MARQTARMLETNRDVIADTYVQYAGLTQRYLEIVKVGNDTYCSNNKDALCYEVMTSKKSGSGLVYTNNNVGPKLSGRYYKSFS